MTAPATVERLRCSHCRSWKTPDCFTPKKDGKRKYQSWCKQCCSEAAAARHVRAPLREEPSERPCWKCQTVKPLSAFSRNKWICRPCAVQEARERREKDPLASRRSYLKSHYGLTLERYDEILEQQGGGCAICGAKAGKQSLHVDHDHRCCPGKKTCGNCIRGILCYGCNTRIALLDTDTDYSLRVRAYLGVTVSRS